MEKTLNQNLKVTYNEFKRYRPVAGLMIENL